MDEANSNDANSTPDKDWKAKRLIKIKRLKAKLINEEHRLVLMKKIRQSQTRPLSSQQQQLQLQQQQQQQQQRQQANQQPQQLQQSQSSRHSNTSLGFVPNQNKRNAIGVSSPHVGNMSRQPITTPPNVVQDIRTNINNRQSLLMNANLSAAAAAVSRRNNQTPQHQQQMSFNQANINFAPNLNKRSSVGVSSPHVGNMSRQPITTPPNVVQDVRASLPGQQSLLMNANLSAIAAAASRRPAQHQQPIKHSSPSIGFTPNVNKRSSAGISSPHVGNLSRQPITTPPNVVQDMRGNMSARQSLLVNSNLPTSGSSRRSQQSSSTPQHQQSSTSSPFNKSQAAQLLLQKRNAAKQAIQKQLEQTLMQLPPKQVQLGIDFIPNANNIEFVYYIGLEACVDYLTGSKNPLDTQALEKPLECSTCGTDFTSSWSWKRSNPVCENCVGNHLKKSIKNAQTNRIKSVLAKAIKQEQDMDQRIMAEAASVVSTPSNTPTTTNNQQTQQQHHLLQQPVSQQQRQQPLSAAIAAAAQAAVSNPQLWPPRVNNTPLNPANNNRTATIQPTVAQNPLGALQPAALASMLQMNPQLGALASLMTANNNNQPPNNTNQLAQVAQLLMNQLTMNLWKR